MATQLVVRGSYAREAAERSGPRRGNAARKFRQSRDHQQAARARGLARTGNAEHDRITVQLLPLVKRLAFQMRGHLPAHVEVNDLIGAGMLGLIDAVRKFDARKHVRLESYAQHRIRGAILDGLRGLDTASRDMRKKAKTAEKVYRELQSKLGRPVVAEEMAVELGMSLKKWYRTVQELRPLGIDWMRPMEVTEFRQADEEALPARPEASAFDRCYRSEQISILNRAMSCLSERDRQLMSLYYEHDLTMKEIGERLGIDESRVSQVHASVLLRLQTRVRVMLRPARSPLPPAHVVAVLGNQDSHSGAVGRTP